MKIEQQLKVMKLPENWATCELDDVLLKISNGANVTQHDEKIGYPICRIETIWNESIDLGRVKYIKENNKEFVDKYALQYGDILLSHINSDAHLGKTGLYKNQVETLIHGINILLIRPVEQFSSDFLNYQIKHLRAKGVFIDAAQRSVNQSSINQKKLKSFQIIVAPLLEQQRIVAKIEELFSELDKGIENLKSTRAQLKVYRQALLKHAFEGKLTVQLRAENQDKLETADALLKRIQHERAERYKQQLADWQTTGGSKPKAPKSLPPLTADELSELPELPQGWGWCKLGDFIDSIDAGKSFKCDEREPRTNEIGVAKVSAVTWGEYDESESKTCTDSSKENEAYLIQRGDFILSRANTIDLVGACVIARKVTKKIMLSDKTLRIRFGYFPQEYFLQYLGSRIGRKQIMLLSTGNQESMRNIGQERIRSITVPICSVVEANVVIESLAVRLFEVDQLELTIATSLQQSEALRQSILKKAFSGKLVAQDPQDEPATALLARIKADKFLRDKKSIQI